MNPEDAAHLVLQVAVIILAAKLFGALCARWLKQPSVLGEIVAGMVIGQHALGGLSYFGWPPLFTGAETELEALAVLAVLASAVLLFHAGLETDVRKFLRYSVAGLVTGLGGAALSFVLGDAATVWSGFAKEGYLSPPALFMGVVATATSVGITARVLSERRKMDTAEGAVILSGAVIDDIIGLVLLAMVAAVMTAGAAGVDWGRLAWIAGKAGIFWVVAVGLGLAFARQIGSALRVFGSNTAICTATLGLAFFLAALAEKAGLALIIGAYIMGLSLSRLDRAHALQNRLASVYDFLVPMFFCMVGMRVNFAHLLETWHLGLFFTLACIAGKVIGCGAAAYPLGFNTLGAARIGVGMAPRQEVALIVAGVALAHGALTPEIFGAVVVMTFVTTLLAPIALARLTATDASGLRKKEKEPPHATAEFEIAFPNLEVADLVADRMAAAFEAQGFFVHRRAELRTYEMRKGDGTIFLRIEGERLVFTTTPGELQYARIIVMEEMVSLNKVFREASDVGSSGQIGGIFGGRV